MSAKSIPKHIAIIMDGNGRWAKQKGLPRSAGHRAGIESVREIIQACLEYQIDVLSLFAFSSENWQRPPDEVKTLMDLFYRALKKELNKLHERNIQLRIIGEQDRFSTKLKALIAQSHALTRNNTGLKLIIAVNYGGRWDIVQAVRQIAKHIESGKLTTESVTSELIASHLSFPDLPEPDLFIRTSGEQRISNFFLWQLAYTELYFTNILWPDFKKDAFEQALLYFAARERRFGATSEQLKLQPELQGHD